MSESPSPSDLKELHASSDDTSTTLHNENRQGADHIDQDASSLTGGDILSSTNSSSTTSLHAPPTPSRPVNSQTQGTAQGEDDIFRALSRRRTTGTTGSGAGQDEEPAEIERLMSRMFGHARQEHGQEERMRHSGVIFRDLTVKGVGLGASLQPTVGDIFLGLPRTIRNFIKGGRKAAQAKPPVRELISHFNGCVRPGELLLVLGRPGAGCSTFLKAFCNQRYGFKAVEGNVTYGGTPAKDIAKHFRGEVIYNPEDDLHYPTLTVKRTLSFALQTRTPGKEDRLGDQSWQRIHSRRFRRREKACQHRRGYDHSSLRTRVGQLEQRP